MSGIRARAFASAVAARYATSSQPRCHIGRVLVHFGRRPVTIVRQGPLHGGLTVRLTHRLIAEAHTRTMLTRAQALVERSERHVATTRQIVERTQRVEQVAVRPGNFSQLATSARSHGNGPAAPRIVVPALPRVLRRATTPAEPPPARTLSSDTVRPRQVPATPPIDVARLTDEVMRGIDKRIAAWRERRGRV